MSRKENSVLLAFFTIVLGLTIAVYVTIRMYHAQCIAETEAFVVSQGSYRYSVGIKSYTATFRNQLTPGDSLLVYYNPEHPSMHYVGDANTSYILIACVVFGILVWCLVILRPYTYKR